MAAASLGQATQSRGPSRDFPMAAHVGKGARWTGSMRRTRRYREQPNCALFSTQESAPRLRAPPGTRTPRSLEHCRDGWLGAALLHVFEMVDMGSCGGSAPPTHMREHTSLTAHLCCTHLDSGPRSVACGRQRRACFPPTP